MKWTKSEWKNPDTKVNAVYVTLGTALLPDNEMRNNTTSLWQNNVVHTTIVYCHFLSFLGWPHIVENIV